ncbi:DNA protecting protein DprA [Pandoraea faecigallinarum]|nr:DNA protecting protein DprA [Pandoraea faecigallinarum]
MALPPAPPVPNRQAGASPDEIADWLRLCHTPGVPPAAARRLLAALGPPGVVFQTPRAVLTEIVPHDVASRLLARTCADLAELIAGTLAWASHPGCTVVTLSEAVYPRALLALGDAPPILYCRGDVCLANRADATGAPGGMAAALVGSRRATPQGRDNARHFARVLGDAGVLVVSGLAAGIDAAAHEGALDTVGSTCAIIGTGADIVYPFRHRALAERIAERGLLLSAFPIGTPPRPEHFPQRNRLIAALARCTAVIEATTHSGSLITARLAGELGRDVLAVPGSIHAPQSQGCHVLIRDGATLAACPEDILEAMGMACPADASSLAAKEGRPRRTAVRHRPPNSTAPRNGEQRLRAAGNGNAGTVAAVHAGMTPEPPEPPVGDSAAAPPAGTAAILEALGYDPVNADTLCERSGLGIATVLSQLGVLELHGRVARLPGGRFVQICPRPAR